MKLKKKFMRFISCVLVAAMILQLTSVQNVRAYTDDEVYKLLQEALKGVPEGDREAIEEAIWDYYSSSNQKAGDWYKACKDPDGDLLPWNYFHNNVQDHITKDSKIDSELDIVYTEEQKKKEDGPTKDTGRADLYLEGKDKTYLWEVKPASYVKEEKRKQAERQLKNYVESKKIMKWVDPKFRAPHFLRKIKIQNYIYQYGRWIDSVLVCPQSRSDTYTKEKATFSRNIEFILKK